MELDGVGLASSNIVRFPNVVDLEKFGPSPCTPPSASNRLRIGFVGRLGPVKRPELLLHVVSELCKRGVNATAIFVGPYRDAAFSSLFRSTMTRLNIEDRVTHVDFTDDVASVMRDEMDVFALPSRSEGLPGALVEAMASGLPVVVTDAGSMREHVQESGAGLVVPADAVAFADALQSVAGDFGARRIHGDSARRYAETTFGSAHAAQVYLSALRLP